MKAPSYFDLSALETREKKPLTKNAFEKLLEVARSKSVGWAHIHLTRIRWKSASHSF